MSPGCGVVARRVTCEVERVTALELGGEDIADLFQLHHRVFVATVAFNRGGAPL